MLDWCGPGFDGCLVFDEAHKAKSFVPGKEGQSTKMALAVLALQEKLPAARVLYCSATGVSEVCIARTSHAGRGWAERAHISPAHLDGTGYRLRQWRGALHIAGRGRRGITPCSPPLLPGAVQPRVPCPEDVAAAHALGGGDATRAMRAVQVGHMAYLSRMGLWGVGTAFKDFSA